MKEKKTVGYLAAVVGGLSFGAIPIVSALMRDLNTSSLEQTLLRLVFGSIFAIAVILFFLFKRKTEVKQSMTSKLQKAYFIQGFIFSLMIIVYLSSISLGTPAGKAALLIQSHPFLTFLFGTLLFQEKITKTKVGALVLALSGLIVLTEPWQWGSFVSSLPGDLLALSNGFLYAFYILVGRWSAKDRTDISATLSISYVLLWGLVIGLPMLLIFRLFPLPSSLIGFSFNTVFNLKIIGLGCLLALFGSIISYGLIMVSAKYVESSTQSILLLDEPVGAIILGAIILQEPITRWYLIGGTAIILAVIIMIISTRINVKQILDLKKEGKKE